MSAKAKLSCNYLSLIKQGFIVRNHWSQSCIPYMIKIHGIIVLTFYIIIICCVFYGTCCIKPCRPYLVSYNVTCLSTVLTPYTKPLYVVLQLSPVSGMKFRDVRLLEVSGGNQLIIISRSSDIVNSLVERENTICGFKVRWIDAIQVITHISLDKIGYLKYCFTNSLKTTISYIFDF